MATEPSSRTETDHDEAGPSRRGRPPLRCYAVCAPGLGSLVADELRALRIRAGRTDVGGVAFRATPRQLYAANAWLRGATRVLVRVGAFGARSFAELERGLGQLDWDGLVVAGEPIRARVTATASELYHTGAIAERLGRVLGVDVVTGAAEADDVALVVVRVARDRVTISVDSSGVPLYRRGWHVAAGPAPLRETLAAAMLTSVGWRATVPLVDPLCGSGTIVVEAARAAAGLPPSLDRTYAFERWPSFEAGALASVRGELAAAQASPRKVEVALVGSDRDPEAVDAARANAEAAGVAGTVEWSVTALSNLKPPAGGPGWVLTNPPFGKRVSGSGDLRNLYATIGNVVRAGFSGWQVGLLCESRALAGHTGLKLHEQFATKHGGLDVTLFTT